MSTTSETAQFLRHVIADIEQRDLSQADQLRKAADLIEDGRYPLAEYLCDRVLDALRNERTGGRYGREGIGRPLGWPRVTP